MWTDNLWIDIIIIAFYENINKLLLHKQKCKYCFHWDRKHLDIDYIYYY